MATKRSSRFGLQPYTQFLVPTWHGATDFQLTISNNHIKFGMPGYGQFWADQDIPSLNWDRALVESSATTVTHQRRPRRRATPRRTPGTSTTSWCHQRFRSLCRTPIDAKVDAGAATVTLDTPSPAGHVSILRSRIDLAGPLRRWRWTSLHSRMLESAGGDEHFRSYCTRSHPASGRLSSAVTTGGPRSWAVLRHHGLRRLMSFGALTALD